MADARIREGFLCPICMQDLGSVADLQQHFDISHAEEDKDVINQLKDFFGKAKQRLLHNMKKEREPDDVFSEFSGEGNAPVSDAGTANAGGIDPSMWEPQEIGATKSYTDGFKRYRDARMDRFVVETNKLLIRLDKLLSPDAPTEANKRKAFEKGVVPWAPDSDVTLCTACGKKFSIARRRHHCRLCGGIICNRCSQFLPFSYAKKLTNPAYQYEGDGFRRSSSSSSLNSILSPEGEPHIRTCEPCRVLLERRDQQIEQRNRKPFLVQLYQKMRIYIEESNKLLPTYLEMAESLQSGETTYNTREATQYRNQIMKLFENIDLLSKRIYTLGTTEPEETPSPTALRLQKMIRSHATNFLQQNMMGLQPLPSEEELRKLQDQKRLEAQQRIDEERRVAAEREKRLKDPQRQEGSELKLKQTEKFSNGSLKEKVIQSTLGWKPQEINAGNADDPMIQQMNIIRGYVKQAKQARKWDEVSMLEDNLRELQKEYWVQQEKNKQQQQYSEQDQNRQQTQQLPQDQTPQFKNVPQVGAHGITTNSSRDNSRRRFSADNSTKYSQPVRRSSTSPKKTTPMGSPSKTSPKVPPTNPFVEESATSPVNLPPSNSFSRDETNPFSENYKDPFHKDSLNPFS